MRVTASSASSHCARLSVAVDAEAAELGLRARLAGAELDAAAGDEVERRDALGDARRMVEVRRELHDAVAQPDALGALAGGGQEHLGRARVRVLLEEVVLDLPHVVDADAVGELDLLERVVQQLAPRRPPPTAAAAGARRRCRIAWYTQIVLLEVHRRMHAETYRRVSY